MKPVDISPVVSSSSEPTFTQAERERKAGGCLECGAKLWNEHAPNCSTMTDKRPLRELSSVEINTLLTTPLGCARRTAQILGDNTAPSSDPAYREAHNPPAVDWKASAGYMAEKAMKLEKELADHKKETAEFINGQLWKRGFNILRGEYGEILKERNESRRAHAEALKCANDFREQRNELSEKFAAKCDECQDLFLKLEKDGSYQRKAIELEDKLNRVQRELTQREKDVVAKVNGLEMAHAQNKHLQKGIIELQDRVNSLEKEAKFWQGETESANQNSLRWRNESDAQFERVKELVALAESREKDARFYARLNLLLAVLLGIAGAALIISGFNR